MASSATETAAIRRPDVELDVDLAVVLDVDMDVSSPKHPRAAFGKLVADKRAFHTLQCATMLVAGETDETPQIRKVRAPYSGEHRPLSQATTTGAAEWRPAVEGGANVAAARQACAWWACARAPLGACGC
jgi:hypothetical protein